MAATAENSLACGCPTNIFSSVEGVAERKLYILCAQLGSLLVLVRLWHMILRLIRLPQYNAEILAATVLGPFFLGQISWVKAALFSPEGVNALVGFSSTGGLLVAFLCGLEMDPSLIWIHGHRAWFSILGSPALVRQATEMKLGTTKVGQLGVWVAVLNDIACITVMALMSVLPILSGASKMDNPLEPLIAVAYPVLAYVLVGPLMCHVMKDRNSDAQMMVVMGIMLAYTAMGEVVGYNGMVASFILGIMVPRKGGVATSLLDRLYYPARFISLPMYMSFTTNVSWAGPIEPLAVLPAFIMVILSTTAKLAISLAMAWVCNTPLHDGLILGFLLNVRSFPDLILFVTTVEQKMIDVRVLEVVMLSSFLNSVIAPLALLGMVSATKKPNVMISTHSGMEEQGPGAELHLLVCLHNAIDVPCSINLIESFRGPDACSLSVNTMHLIEYNERTAAQLLYRRDITHMLVGGESKQISDAFEAYRSQVAIPMRHSTTVSFFFNMHEDICRSAEEVEASMIVLPYHMLYRADGKMQVRNSAIRKLNQRVISHAPCPVGIIINRGLGGTTLWSASGMSKNRNVFGLFFGGPSDCEAITLGGRLAEHPDINFTLVHFLCSRHREQASSQVSSKAAMVQKSSPKVNSFAETDKPPDQMFLNSFRRMYEKNSRVFYEERTVRTKQNLVATLQALDAECTLFIVGQGQSLAAAGLMRSTECSELGPVGDLLAHSLSSITSSVLIVIKSRSHKSFLL
ncbi:cation/H(+) antiporter 19 isoform X2 [Amborella trichopoda]|uniref:cation/H(+) antiporter 19 isoform X2 n=1 Tax=Amborella trichopoda TaxID=13333 RepID=UPI0009C110D2|nr:cation/H(+) antiporter 19 isoform X2 [Amborella trichopoda]|eukprot:XP_020532061.1 cation/H(+) antiporter 19 isoform X2 [Amborella trichopoda]